MTVREVPAQNKDKTLVQVGGKARAPGTITLKPRHMAIANRRAGISSRNRNRNGVLSYTYNTTSCQLFAFCVPFLKR